ncbi:MAG: rhodanese-like domain-containing protein [Pseudomonadota bacterium]|nr:rhodanese-like domain-containing protein [Pseudomonadota bacterium]
MRQVSVEEARDLLDSAAPPLLVDCRQSWEHELCHLPGDVLLPLDEVIERGHELERGRPVLVYCHAGVRSINAAVLLERQGFETMSMRGGIEAWSLRIDPTVPRY